MKFSSHFASPKASIEISEHAAQHRPPVNDTIPNLKIINSGELPLGGKLQSHGRLALEAVFATNAC